MFFLDYLTDGQLGYGEENSLSPCLVERFQDLGSPETLQSEAQNSSTQSSLKVQIDHPFL
jgi:E3 ubiquitin-protein ligase RFWD2